MCGNDSYPITYWLKATDRRQKLFIGSPNLGRLRQSFINGRKQRLMLAFMEERYILEFPKKLSLFKFFVSDNMWIIWIAIFIENLWSTKILLKEAHLCLIFRAGSLLRDLSAMLDYICDICHLLTPAQFLADTKNAPIPDLLIPNTQKIQMWCMWQISCMH